MVLKYRCFINLVFHDFFVFLVFILLLHEFIFFFSSRRRHTRWNCDWSSDVCSSDLLPANSDLSSPSLMATFPRRIRRNYVERYALVVYRQSSCIELSFDAHFLEFVALSLVWAESFERQAGFEVWLELDNSSIYHDLFGYGSLL